MAWHPAEADTSAFVAQCPEEIHDLANERVVGIFSHNCLQARHFVSVDYNIVLYRIHMPIVGQCQGDGCCLSSKYGTVIWESFGQLAASRLTILEMAVDDPCCPHSLVNLRSVSVDFIMRSLGIAILWIWPEPVLLWPYICSPVQWDCVSSDRIHAFLAERMVSSGGRLSTSIPAEVMASSILRPMGCAGVGTFLFFQLA